MHKKQSKPCRLGSNCKIKECAFKHPPKMLLDEDFAPTTCVLNGDDQTLSDQEESAFIAQQLHYAYINNMTSAIIYTGWSMDEPYVIETHPELGTFPSWDDAYDAMLDYVYLNMGDIGDMDETYDYV